MTDDRLPPALVDGLLRLCQGDFAHRLPRSHARDTEDTIAFFVNTIAEELGGLITQARAQEVRLTALVERVSEALQAVVAGDFSKQIDRDFTGDATDVLAFLVNNTIVELGLFVGESQRRAEEERQRLEAMVAERTRELERLATTDTLTGALNRRRVFELADEEVQRASRYQRPLCLSMLDLDHFKSLNDRFGHQVGDEALKTTAETVRSQLRRSDLLGRYGGEEFMLVLPETPRDTAASVLERVRTSVAGLRMSLPDLRVTVSIGVVEFQPGESLDAGLRRADSALYQAKSAGRDRVQLG